MSSVAPFVSNRKSAKNVRDNVIERRLRAISKSIDFSKLDHNKSLPTDEFGHVKIDPSHPAYKYWTKDDK